MMSAQSREKSMLRAPLWRVLGLAFAVLSSGCMGSGEFTGVEGETSGTPLPGTPNIDPTTGLPAAAPGTYEFRRDQLSVLPFRIRLAKVANVLGVTTDHPALEQLRVNHLELGDHNFAGGIAPDKTWTASRVSNWVKALRPVCNSAEMKALYPSFTDKLDDFTLAAFGRYASPDDLAAVQDATTAFAADPASGHLTVCLAFLASAEFVSR